MPTRPQAHVRLRHTVVTNQRGDQQLLLELYIDCEACGVTEGVIAGHHLKALHQVLGTLIDRYPDLVGHEADQIEESQLFEGTAPAKGRERLN